MAEERNQGAGREYPARPIVAVGGIVIDGERVLLVRRHAAPAQDLWSIPGGAVEVGETLTDALVREMREETGLDVEIGHVVEIADRIVRDDDGLVRYHYVIIDFLCHAAGGTLRSGSDSAEARFVTLAEARALSTTRGLGPVLERAFAHARGAGGDP